MANILDLDPFAFAAALEELQLPEEDAARLREQYRQKQSPFAGAKEALSPEEGRNTSGFLPVSVPEGMSIAEGVTSGNWDWAVPEGLSGGATALMEGVEAPGQVASGVPFSEQELQDAAWKTAGAGAAGSLTAPVPEGATRMFGGWNATNPGYTRSGLRLPESVGVDNKWRFEISDLDSVVVPQNFPKADSKTPSFNPNKDTATLADVMIHDELFYQYPELRDQRIFVDTSLENTNTLGYHDNNTGLMAISPKLLEDPDFLRSVLLHEIQHPIQHREGFATGTNVRATEVEDVAKNISQERVQKIQEEKAAQDKLLRDYEEFDFEEGYMKLEEGTQNFVESLGLDWNKFLTQKIPVENLLWDMQHATKRLIDSYWKYRQNLQKGGVDAKFAKANFTTDISVQVQEIARVSSKDPQFSEAFKNTFGIEPQELRNMPYREVESYLEGLGVTKVKPFARFIPEPRQAVTLFDREEAYHRKSGEVEARNVQERRDWTINERFQIPPERSEDVPRDKQWYATGGMVQGTNMEQNMTKLFAEGGINTGDAEVDPVSGNEVPPGSLPEEVRDDVDAKLSGGEYVVPADVLRYYGVSFFEKLRKKAKEGLAEMDAEGRIGGDTAPAEGMTEGPEMDEEDDDLPFGEDELMYEEDDMEFATGGMVPGQAAFNPNQFYAGFSAFGDAPQQQIENRTYVNASGQRMSIQFINGQPQQAIPAGFYPEGQLPASATNPTQPTASGANERPNADEQRSKTRENTEQGFDWAKGKDFKNMSATEAAALANSRLEGNSMAQGLAQGVGSLLGPAGALMSGAMKMRPVAEVNGIERHLRSIGNTEAADAVAAIGDKYVSERGIGLRALENVIAPGTQVAKTLAAMQGQAAAQPAGKTGGSAAGRAVVKDGDRSGGTGTTKGPISGPTGGSSQKKGSAAPAAKSAPSKSAPSKPAPTKNTGGQKASDRSGGRFKEGGLIERRKK